MEAEVKESKKIDFENLVDQIQFDNFYGRGASFLITPLDQARVFSKEMFTEDQKMQARRKLEIPENAIVVLYVGRLSFHAKANPFPMYKALENAANISNKKIQYVSKQNYKPIRYMKLCQPFAIILKFLVDPARRLKFLSVIKPCMSLCNGHKTANGLLA